HRITHPKAVTDLELSDADTEACKTAFYWLLESSIRSMESTVIAARLYSDGIAKLFDELKSGNPAAWEAYNEAKEDLNKKK
ncbi:MAG: hypothetical protein AAFY42_11070, partial [Pseudomonadota bacterium]